MFLVPTHPPTTIQRGNRSAFSSSSLRRSVWWIGIENFGTSFKWTFLEMRVRYIGMEGDGGKIRFRIRIRRSVWQLSYWPASNWPSILIPLNSGFPYQLSEINNATCSTCFTGLEWIGWDHVNRHYKQKESYTQSIVINKQNSI